VELDKFVKDIRELFGFIINGDVPCGSIVIKSRKELIELFCSPAWIWKGCMQASCSFDKIAFPVKRVISGPCLVDGVTFNSS